MLLYKCFHVSYAYKNSKVLDSPLDFLYQIAFILLKNLNLGVLGSITDNDDKFVKVVEKEIHATKFL